MGWISLVHCASSLRLLQKKLSTLTNSINCRDYLFEVGQLPIKGTTGALTYVIGTPLRTPDNPIMPSKSFGFGVYLCLLSHY